MLVLRIVTAGVFIAAIGCGHGAHGPSEPKPPAEPLAAKICKAEIIEWPLIVRVQGNLAADEVASLSSRVAGLVEEVAVERGQVVRKGDLLVQLRRRDFDLKVAQAQAQVDQTRAKLGLGGTQKDEEVEPRNAPPVRQEVALLNEALARYERLRTLRTSGAASEEELQAVKAAVEVSQARLQSAQNQVRELVATLALARAELDLAKQAQADAEVRAPFAGIIDQKLTAPGAYVQPGTPLVVLVRTDPLRFTAGVPERRALAVDLGQQAVIVLEGRKQPLEGQVTRVAPGLATASRSLTVEIDVPNPGHEVPAGFFAEADILVDPESRTLAIPLAALSEFAGVEKVWLVRDGAASEVRVRTGRRTFQHVEILAGLQPGDTVLADARLGRAGPVTVQGTVKNPTPKRRKMKDEG